MMPVRHQRPADKQRQQAQGIEWHDIEDAFVGSGRCCC